MWIPSLVVALALASTVTGPPDQPPGGVRSQHARIRAAVQEGMKKSSTFGDLVERLQRSTVIVYVERGRCRCPNARSCLAFVAGTGGVRYVRAQVKLEQSQRSLIEQIAHELHHAVEVAEAPHVTSRDVFVRFFAELARSDCPAQRCFETTGALAAEGAVRRELSSRAQARHVR